MRHESDTVALTCSMILCSSTRSLALAHQLVLISPDSGSAILIVLIVCRCTLPAGTVAEWPALDVTLLGVGIR